MRFLLPGVAARPLLAPITVLLLVAASVVAPAWWVHSAPPAEVDAAAKSPAAAEDSAAAEENKLSLPKSPEEARVRSRLLHEMIHGSLQVMHRDFFKEDESFTLPSQSLEDVFVEMEERWQVEIRWLIVNAEPMNVDHNPKDDFEKAAAKALAGGAEEYEAVEANRFRFVGTVRLGSQCLKCHVPKRTSLEDRAAGLVISMPIEND